MLTELWHSFAETFVWKELRTSGQKIIPRAGHTTVALRKYLFVFGGFTDDRKLFDDLHVLNVGMFCSLRTRDSSWKKITVYSTQIRLTSSIISYVISSGFVNVKGLDEHLVMH